MDCVKYDMKQNSIRPEWASDRDSWFGMIRNINPYPGNDGKVTKVRNCMFELNSESATPGTGVCVSIRTDSHLFRTGLRVYRACQK